MSHTVHVAHRIHVEVPAEVMKDLVEGVYARIDDFRVVAYGRTIAADQIESYLVRDRADEQVRDDMMRLRGAIDCLCNIDGQPGDVDDALHYEQGFDSVVNAICRAGGPL